MNNVTSIRETYLSPIVEQAPEQCHPAQINFANFDNNPALKRASDALGHMWEKQEAIREARNNPDPEKTPAAHDRVIANALDVHERDYAPKFDGAKAELKAERSRVESQLVNEAGFKPNDKFVNATLGAFNNMEPHERQQALLSLIEEGDGASLATLAEAPAFISGLTAEQKAMIKPRLFERTNPRANALLGQLDKALGKMEAASIAALSYRQQLRAGTDRYAKRAAAAAEREAKAMGSAA